MQIHATSVFSVNREYDSGVTELVRPKMTNKREKSFRSQNAAIRLFHLKDILQSDSM
jgi:hypothetical protein